MSQGAKLRKLLEREQAIYIPGAYSALSARLIEQSGFSACYMSGLATALSVLGAPDAGLITMSEMVQTAKQIVEAINIPLIADCDNGYGNAINTMRSVREYLLAGVAGVHVEDELLPKRVQGGRILLNIEEACGKIRAADQIRKMLDKEFILIARTDSCHIPGGGLTDAITRANAYLEAGADMAFINKPPNIEAVKRISAEVRGPLFYNQSGNSPRFSIQEMKALRIAIAIDPSTPLKVTTTALSDYLCALKERGPSVEYETSETLREHPASDLRSIAEDADVRRWEEQYLPIKT